MLLVSFCLAYPWNIFSLFGYLLSFFTHFGVDFLPYLCLVVSLCEGYFIRVLYAI